jgi:hypothetical protein
LDAFPDEPRRDRARLAIFTILRVDGSRENIIRAAGIIEELAAKSDPARAEGRDILFQLIDFEVGYARGTPACKLDLAKAAVAKLGPELKDPASPEAIRLLAFRTWIRVLEGDPHAALNEALDGLDAAMNLSASGVWTRMWQNDRPGYAQCMSEMSSLASAAAWAAARVDPSRAQEAPLAYPMLVADFPSPARGIARTDARDRSDCRAKRRKRSP